MKRTSARSVTVSMLALACAGRVSFGRSSGAIAVADKIEFRALPFAPGEVRLTSGPFREAQDRDARYLLDLDPDRLLSGFRTESGLTPKAKFYGGWESQGVRGQSFGHYLSALAFAYADTGDARFAERARYCIAELDACQEARHSGLLAAYDNSGRIFDEIARGDIRYSGFDLNGGWVPWYTNHKVLAGLRDAYLVFGDPGCKKVLLRFADWCVDLVGKLSDEQMQRMIGAESGGMNEVLADCYAISGDAKYLEASKRWYHRVVLDPLAARQDKLAGLHANTQIPKLIGLARLHELTGDASDATAAAFFWDRVVEHRTYANGGNSVGEHLGPPDALAGTLNGNTAETCNVYNMIKLSSHLFRWTGEPKYAEYAERALYNQILASQGPGEGMVTYYQRFHAGARKDYSTPYDSFWCCVGTGMENHVTYGNSIYFHSGDRLYVNQFISSTLEWRDRGVHLSQETELPTGDTTRLALKMDAPRRLTISLRRPEWTSDPEVRVNGRVVTPGAGTPGYLEVSREFAGGDVIEYRTPMSLHVRPLPDKPSEVAFFCGPVMLAGIEDSPDLLRTPTVFVGSPDKPQTLLEPVPGQPLTFRSLAAQPSPLTFTPYFRTEQRRYQAYFDTFTAAQWARQQERYVADQAEAAKLAAVTLDSVAPGEQQSEVDHQMRQSRTEFGDGPMGVKWRHVLPGGWLEYTLRVDPVRPNVLRCNWWGGDNGRTFDLLIDGHPLAAVAHDGTLPGQYFHVGYAIPPAWTAGKSSVTLRVAPRGSSIAGGMYGVQVIAGDEASMPSELRETDAYVPSAGESGSAAEAYHAVSAEPGPLLRGDLTPISGWRQAHGELSMTLASDPTKLSRLRLTLAGEPVARRAEVLINGTPIGAVEAPADDAETLVDRDIDVPAGVTADGLYLRISLRATPGEETPRLAGARLLPIGPAKGSNVVDFVHVGNVPMEAQKLLVANLTRSGSDPVGLGLRWRDARPGGAFGYRVRVDPERANTVSVAYWGNDEGRDFRLNVDGVPLAEVRRHTQGSPNAPFWESYEVPAASTKGKSEVVLTFDAAAGQTVGGAMGIIVRAK